jgi:hypothetical protein
MRNVYKIFVGTSDLEGRDHVVGLGVDERIILKLVLKNMMIRTGFMWLKLGYGPVADLVKHVNEPKVSIKVGNMTR